MNFLRKLWANLEMWIWKRRLQSAYAENVRLKKKLLICGRCYDSVPALYPANCEEKPEEFKNAPLGMYHCPGCGAMILAGLPHPNLCERCRDRKHPAFDAA